MRHELGRRNVFFVHVSLVPFMGASGEQKTKPTQHSVAALRSIGIQPDALVLRSDRPVSESNKRKIALMCDVDERAVVNAIDVASIYDIPTMLHDQGLDAYIIEQLGLDTADEVDWAGWQQLLDTVHDPKHEVTIALVGKYIDLPDAYLSVTEALKAGGFAHAEQGQHPLGPLGRLRDARGRRPQSRRRRRHPRAGRIRRARHRGQARRAAVRARERHPGARPVPRPAVHGDRVRAQHRRAHRRLVVRVRPRHRVPGHRDDGRAGRHHRPRRHGRHDAARPVRGRARVRARSSRSCTAPPEVSERHRHRYEVNNHYRDQIADAGMRVLRRLARPLAGRVRRAAARRCTRSTSGPRRTRSCGRGRTARIRCSAG